MLSGAHDPFASFLRVPFVPKPKPRRDPHEVTLSLSGAENTERKELSGGQESAGNSLPEGKSTPSPSSSKGTSSPSSSSPPSTPPSPPLHLVIAVAIRPLMQHFISLGTQFIGYRDTVNGLKEGSSRVTAASAGRRTLERKELSGGRNPPGKFPPEGEIDAIAIVIERDIISIIIIISTIYTAITTAAPRISMNEVRKKLFTISLSGKAAHWYKLLKNGDSIDWEDIVPLFYSKFYPPSEIHKDRNRIYNFWPHDGESIAQAWGRLKSLMLKCPIHELPGNVIIDNFYARLSFQDKTLLDTSCSGSFTRKNEEFKRDLLDRIQENTEGWENDKDRESVKDLVTENVEDGHIIFCEDASNIVSHPNKSKQVSVPMLSVRIGDHCYYGLCDIGASVSAIPYELYTEIMHEIGSCELEDIDVVIHLANRETISPIGIVRDVEVLCGSSPACSLDSFPCVEEAIRVADEFCDQYRALRREVEILQEENQRLRRMLEYYSNPSTRPSPPHSGNNESFQVLVQNCKIEKLKLKEILMKREKNPSPPSPKE
ncbi:hypothetical protein QYE76_041471 [Lolium multiflorum]|uniref:Retrotransposon gag domain-containing protein n=1 Tax=Lolium multiflorum TaxID=4521 RepID=A0AAD8TEU9_LOLMU|nr:hypothetical protein QYE76_041471 [Lolium multiflorum]